MLSVHRYMILFLFLFLLSCSQLLICPFYGTPKLMRGTKRRYEEVQPQLQRDIVNDYRRGVRGHGYLTIAKKHQLPIQTVRSVITRAERAGGIQSRRVVTRRGSWTALNRRGCTVVSTEPSTYQPAIEGSCRQQNRSKHSKSLSSSCETAI